MRLGIPDSIGDRIRLGGIGAGGLPSSALYFARSELLEPDACAPTVGLSGLGVLDLPFLSRLKILARGAGATGARAVCTSLIVFIAVFIALYSGLVGRGILDDFDLDLDLDVDLDGLRGPGRVGTGTGFLASSAAFFVASLMSPAAPENCSFPCS